MLLVCDLACYRHCERLLNSGYCGCSRAALRTIVKKPTNEAELLEVCAECVSLTYEDRYCLSHNPLPGETAPRPCPAEGCTFGHSDNPMAELAAFHRQEAELLADSSPQARAKYDRWRLHFAHSHQNVQPGQYGHPTLDVDTDDMALDSLHGGDLNLPYPPLKRFLSNCSDDARAESDVAPTWPRSPIHSTVVRRTRAV